MSPLQDHQLYRALIARDVRFDGVFFVGVTSTGVYCRPVCPAPTPRPDRCRYFSSAAAAERRGFRSCLRCRPELAPGEAPEHALGRSAGGCQAGVPSRPTASVDAVRRLARDAAARIAAGALDRQTVGSLAVELGVSERHLRRAVERELGATPAELAQTRRLLLAKQLVSETELSFTRVALASGFNSVRRFNALFRKRYRMAPTALRRGTACGRKRGDQQQPQSGGRTVPRNIPASDEQPLAESVTLTLAFRPPLDWEALLAYLEARATPGVEVVTRGKRTRYWRSVELKGHRGYLALESAGDGSAGKNRRALSQQTATIRLELSATLLPVLVPLLARVRRLLDLEADPQTVAAHLGADPALAPLVRCRPGLRAPGAIDGFEIAVRAILGQQVSVRVATTLAGRLVERLGEPLPTLVPSLQRGRPGLSGIVRLPVTAERLADASLPSVMAIGLPRTRASCLIALGRAVADGTLPELTCDATGRDPAAFTRRIVELPGVGAWTAAYVAMRALHWPDAFPEGDLVLRKALGGLSAARLRIAADAWRPWRAYAAHHLWASASAL